MAKEEGRCRGGRGNRSRRGNGGSKGRGGLKARSLIMAGGIVAIVIVLASVAAFLQLTRAPAEEGPELEVLDATGRRPEASSGDIETVKVSIRNTGTGAVDLRKVSLTWHGPEVDTTLTFDASAPLSGDKVSFGVGGLGNVEDGWDPANGSYKVKGGTLAWLTINLTSTGGIGEDLGAGKVFEVTVEVGGTGGGDVPDATAAFEAPDDLGSGTVVAFKKVELK